MKRLRAVLVAVAVVVPTLSASAATVGLDGGNSDPIPLTDPTWQELFGNLCGFANHVLPADYRCALYDGSFIPTLTSIDFRLRDGNGIDIPAPDGITQDTIFVLLPFLSISPINDGYTFRLSGFGHCDTCVFFASHPGGDEDPRYVSIVAVNDIESIPEPGVLALLAPAAALALRRRVRDAITWKRRRVGAAARNADRRPLTEDLDRCARR